MVDEVHHLLESLRVCVVEEEPLVIRIAQAGAEIWAGDGEKESVTTKLLPGWKCLRIFVCPLMWQNAEFAFQPLT